MNIDNKPLLLSFCHSGLTLIEWKQCLSRFDSPASYFSQDIRRDGAVGGFGWPAPQFEIIQVDQFVADSANWASSILAAFPRFDDIYKDAGIGVG